MKSPPAPSHDPDLASRKTSTTSPPLPWTWIFKIGRKSKVVCGPEKPRPAPTCFDSRDSDDCRTPAEIGGHGANVETTHVNKYVGKEWKLSCERCTLSWGDLVWVCCCCCWSWILFLNWLRTDAALRQNNSLFLFFIQNFLKIGWFTFTSCRLAAARLHLQLQLPAPK